MTDLRAAARTLLDEIEPFYRSGNSIPVERAVITAKVMVPMLEALRAAMDAPVGGPVAVVNNLTTARLSVIGDPPVGTKLYTHASTQPSEWRTIESAPQGTIVLMCSMKTSDVSECMFVDWFAGDKKMLHPKWSATHWMPLPAPPKGGE